jgi:hypothetical protein
VATTPDYDPATQYISFTESDFRVIGPDGVTVPNVTGNAYSCLGSGRTLSGVQIGPGQQYVGTVVIDSPVTSGSLVFAPAGSATGWEWEF